MSEELDPQLLRLFADAGAPLDEAAFVAESRRRLQAARRGRQLRRAALGLALLLLASVLAPAVIDVSVEASEHLTTLFSSPWGLGVSFVVGALVVWRARAAVSAR